MGRRERGRHETFVTLSNLDALADDFPEVSQAVLTAVGKRNTSWGSVIHGPPHWTAVAKTGRQLAERTPGADSLVVVLFAILHDCLRASARPTYWGSKAAVEAQWGLRGVEGAAEASVSRAVRRHERMFA